jgi:fatty-acyl-CoA synthase
MMPYTSGSTGKPKGCMHTHASVLHNVVGAAAWKHIDANTVALATAPFFHVTGLVHSFLATLWAGGTMVIQRRWDPLEAARLVERHRCTHWDNVPTMVVDLLSHPKALEHDVRSLKWIFGGGTAMPEAIAQKLFDLCGVRYIEGYGLTETISQTHINPPQNPKKQCLGIPTFDTEALVVDPESLKEVKSGVQGEIVVRGPQLLTGYWKNEKAYAESWCAVEGREGRFFRTGDLGRVDEDGYFYISDRLKRMINASGYKVWPAEVEARLYKHPAIQECCIIASPDERRGETVKAVVVLKPGASASAEEILDWARGQMATYKAPRKIEFAGALPRTGSGKIQWRELQEKEFLR